MVKAERVAKTHGTKVRAGKVAPRAVEMRVLLSDEEQVAFKGEAEKLGIQLAPWVRMTLRRAAGLA